MNRKRFRRLRTATRQGGWWCWWCGEELTRNNATIDHVLPRSKGGTNAPSNIVLCCNACNQAKGDMHPLKWIASYFGMPALLGHKVKLTRNGVEETYVCYSQVLMDGNIWSIGYEKVIPYERETVQRNEE